MRITTKSMGPKQLQEKRRPQVLNMFKIMMYDSNDSNDSNDFHEVTNDSSFITRHQFSIRSSPLIIIH